MLVLAILLVFSLFTGIVVLIAWDMERYARKQSRKRREGKPYVNVPGAEKDYY